MGEFEWGLGFDWRILQAALDRDRLTFERLVATFCDGAGDDYIDQEQITAWLVLAIIVDRKEL